MNDDKINPILEMSGLVWMGLAVGLPNVYFHLSANPYDFMDKLTLLYVIGPIAIFLWASGTLWERGKFRKRRTPLDRHLMLFILLMGVLTLVAPNRCRALLKLGMYAYCAAGFFLVSEVFPTERDGRKFLTACALGGVAAAAIGCLDYFFGLDPISWDTDWGYRTAAAFYDPNFFGGFMGMQLLIGIGMTVVSKGWRRYLWAGASGCFVLGLIISYSRSAWIATLIGVCLYLAYHGGLRMPRMGALLSRYVAPGLFIVAVAAVPSVYTQIKTHENLFLKRIESIPGFPGVDGRQRVLYWKSTLQMIEANPLSGVGLNAYRTRYSQYQARFMKDPKWYAVRMNSCNAYNDYLEMAAEMGVPALLLFLAFIVRFYLLCFRRRRSAAKDSRVLGAALCGAVTVFLAQGALFQFPFSCVAMLFLFFSLTGLTLRVYERSENTSPQDAGAGVRAKPAAGSRIAVAAAHAPLIAVMCGLLWLGTRPFFGSSLTRVVRTPVMMFRGAQGKNPYVSTTDPAFLNRAELFMRCFPCDTGISLLLGITYHDYGDTTRAIRKLRYALTVTNATPIAHLYLASAYFKRKDYRNCIVHYEVASRLEPSIRTRAVFTQHKEAVADAYCHIGNIAMATTLYNEYFREYPGDARALRRARLCSVKIRK